MKGWSGGEETKGIKRIEHENMRNKELKGGKEFNRDQTGDCLPFSDPSSGLSEGYNA